MSNASHKKRYITMFCTLLIVFTCLVVLFYQITYAKYHKEITGTVENDVADWHIKINNEDVYGKSKLTNTIQATFENNNYTKDGVIAPGSVGYFYLDIDATNCDVDFNYTITLAVSQDSTLQDLVPTTYQIGTGGTPTAYTNSGITGSIVKNSASQRFIINIKWNDSTGQTQDNAADTAIGANSSATALMEVTINLSQKTS
ncbi:MAG: hypothetical protein IJL76_02250 [Bacilli bacterium]|nr:hypothetical protein [Bacilli bacterium]